MSVKARLARWWVYFNRGHSTYFAVLLTLLNFLVVQYRLLLDYVPPLKAAFASLTSFAMTLLLVYIPAAIIIGWLDYKKLAMPVDLAAMARANPYARDFARALMLMCDVKYEEARRVLEKWVPS